MLATGLAIAYLGAIACIGLTPFSVPLKLLVCALISVCGVNTLRKYAMVSSRQSITGVNLRAESIDVRIGKDPTWIPCSVNDRFVSRLMVILKLNSTALEKRFNVPIMPDACRDSEEFRLLRKRLLSMREPDSKHASLIKKSDW